MEGAAAGDTRSPNAIPGRIATGNRYRLKSSLVVAAPVREKAAKGGKVSKGSGKGKKGKRRKGQAHELADGEGDNGEWTDENSGWTEGKRSGLNTQKGVMKYKQGKHMD